MLRRLLRGNPGAAAPSLDGAHEDVAQLEREGPRPLAPGAAEASTAASLRVAVVVPWLLEGSGGHTTILNLVRRLELRGHDCSLWVHDPGGRHAAESNEALAAKVTDWYGGMRGPVRRGFDDWQGADVALATGWQTVHRVLLLDGCRARAYLVQDHEPEFYATSAESRWAAETYRLGLHCITAGTWLRDLMAHNYGAGASHFDLGVDHGVYRPRELEREPKSILFYARTITPRRAVPLGMLALAEVKRRDPGVRVHLFGDERRPPASFHYHHLGLLAPEALAATYARLEAGLVLSLTNYSLIAQEMMACGLPCVELDGRSTRAAFGNEPPLELAAPTPAAIADALERLLRDPELRAERRAAGLAFVAERTWEHAAEQVEDGLRAALRPPSG
ncbi:MAG: glycosyltransferase family 4 protein [Thermoleophilaceae bacterium]